jgi:hypothetical protein
VTDKLNSKSDNIAWRRAKVVELTTKGWTQDAIAKELMVSQASIASDIKYFKDQARDNVKKYMDSFLPAEFTKVLLGIDNVLKKAWSIIDDDKDKDVKNKISALSLCNQSYSLQVELLTSTEVLSNAMEFVKEHVGKRNKTLRDNLKKELEQVDHNSNGKQQQEDNNACSNR